MRVAWRGGRTGWPVVGPLRALPMLLVLLAPLALLRPADASAQEDAAPVPPELEEAVRRVAGLELQMLEGVQDTAVVRARQEALAGARERLLRLLDTHVVQADRGPAILATLRERYPGATILDRYAADLALRDGRPAEAADAYRRLLAIHPDDAALHRGLGAAWRALGQQDRAWAAYRRALDLEPRSGPAFRALVALAGDTAALESLLRQVRRLRRLAGDGDDALLDREVELLHRLGRAAEARRVREARDTTPAVAEPGPGGGG